jgi:aldehyde dehydrogenase (NAD+)
VAPIIPAANEEEALMLANQTTFGLSSCVFGRDIERATRFAQRLEAGMAHVNDQPVNDLANNPFDGEKNSGIGRFGGGRAVEAFTTDKWVTCSESALEEKDPSTPALSAAARAHAASRRADRSLALAPRRPPVRDGLS